MRDVVIFLLVVLVLGMAALLLGSHIGATLTELLFPETGSVLPPAKAIAGGQFV